MANVRSIPEGLHTLTPHLTIRDAAKAMDFYKRAFGAQEVSRHGGPNNLIMHASMRIGDSMFLLNDEFPGMGNKSPSSLGGTTVSLTLYFDDVDKVFKQAVDAGAQITMPLADQFWGDRYGVVTDPFGHMWALATHKEDLTPAELDRRGREAVAQMMPK